ncbi:MAG: HD domain-containing protein [Candidatus Eisenbacteria sp.]|nr:HD domain-containing protein [Candidatus Eisenbacteria bacterium]
MKNELRKLISEFDLIQDKNLREATLAVWEKAMMAGGWSITDLTRIPFTLLIEGTTVDYVAHVRGVTKVMVEAARVLKETYGNQVKINHDYLVMGGLLHDIGKLVEYEEKNGKFVKSGCGELLRHPFSGVGLCYEAGIPTEVQHMIACHSKEGDLGKRTVEAIILHHADFTNFECLKA